jgi:hypothetical protein
MKKIISFFLLAAVVLLLPAAGIFAKDPPGASSASHFVDAMVEGGQPSTMSPLASSESFVLDWSVLSAGAGDISSSTFEIDGTLGQPFVGQCSSSTFDLTSGFWPGPFYMNGVGAAGSGDAIISFQTWNNQPTILVSNIGSSGLDGIAVHPHTLGATGFGASLSNVDLSPDNAGVYFQANGSTGVVPASEAGAVSQIVGGVGFSNVGGAIQVVADFTYIGDPNVYIEVYQNGSITGGATIASGGLVAIGTDAGSGMPSVISVSMNASDPPGFTVTLDRNTRFTLVNSTILIGDEIRLIAQNATQTVEELTSFEITGTYLGYMAITDIEFSSGCCRGFTGNVDDDPTDLIDLGDLTALIDYLFISFTEPECIEEANIDGDAEGLVDLGDLTALIDFLFISFTPPAACQ